VTAVIRPRTTGQPRAGQRRAGQPRAGQRRATGQRRAGQPRATGQRRDRGSVSLFLSIFAIAAFILLALLVDGGTALNAKMRAADIAEQAARAAANQVDVADLRSPNPTVVIGPGACAAAASIVAQYQVTSHTSASVSNCDAIPGSTKATIEVSVRTSPVIPLLFGNFTMTASASAYPACGITNGGQC
jgi:Flp pilus assembly protein TadG